MRNITLFFCILLSLAGHTQTIDIEITGIGWLGDTVTVLRQVPFSYVDGRVCPHVKTKSYPVRNTVFRNGVPGKRRQGIVDVFQVKYGPLKSIVNVNCLLPPFVSDNRIGAKVAGGTISIYIQRT
jgi:hypothetical protein